MRTNSSQLNTSATVGAGNLAAKTLTRAAQPVIASRLSGVGRVTFYTPVRSMRRDVTVWLLFISIIGAVMDLASDFVFAQILWWTFGLVVSAFLLSRVAFTDEIALDLNSGYYALRSGLAPHIRIRTGSLSEIARIRIAMIFSPDGPPTYQAFIEFDGFRPVRIDNKRCGFWKSDSWDRYERHRQWMSFLAELAARLNVPLVDDSGWRGWQPRVSHPERIVVLPGETHPYLLPQRWKRW